MVAECPGLLLQLPEHAFDPPFRAGARITHNADNSGTAGRAGGAVGFHGEVVGINTDTLDDNQDGIKEAKEILKAQGASYKNYILQK